MIDSTLSTLMTPKAANGQQASLQAKALAGNNTGLFAGVAGLNFMDLIFARLTAEAQNGKKSGEGMDSTLDQPALPADIAALFKTPLNKIIGAEDPALEGMPLEVFMAGLPQLPLDADPVMLDPADASAAMDIPAEILVPAASGNSPLEIAVNEFLEALLAGMPAETRLVAVKITPGQINRALKLQTNAHESYPPGLIGTNLTPQALTDLIGKIEQAQNEGRDIYALGLIKIVPAAENAGKQAFIPFSLVTAQNLAQNPEENTGDEAEASQDGTLMGILNALMKGTPPASFKPGVEQTALQNAPLAADPLADGAEAALPPVPESTEGFDRIMDQLKSLAHDKTDAGILAGVKADKADKAAAAPHIIQHPFAVSGSIDSWSSWQETFPEGMDWMAAGMGNRGIGLNGTAAMTSLVTHAPHASAPHPSTQMVAASVSRLAAAGENKVFSLKLDPPELGRVEIRMTFGKDKTLDTRLVVEKPETWMMLQRDAHALERAMQNSGISTDSLNLSFELAQHHENKSGNGESGHSGNAGDKTGLPESAAAGDEVIESTMTWYVDPATGRQRYDLVV